MKFLPLREKQENLTTEIMEIAEFFSKVFSVDSVCSRRQVEMCHRRPIQQNITEGTGVVLLAPGIGPSICYGQKAIHFSIDILPKV